MSSDYHPFNALFARLGIFSVPGYLAVQCPLGDSEFLGGFLSVSVILLQSLMDHILISLLNRAVVKLLRLLHLLSMVLNINILIICGPVRFRLGHITSAHVISRRGQCLPVIMHRLGGLTEISGSDNSLQLVDFSIESIQGLVYLLLFIIIDGAPLTLILHRH